MGTCKIKPVYTLPGGTLEYVTKNEKTQDGALIFCNHCSADWKIANLQMEANRIKFGKNNKILAHHGHVSFKGDEVSYEKALMMAEAFMNKNFSNFQYLGGVHVDTKNVHWHFVINAVGLDGKKYAGNKTTLEAVRAEVDKMCEENNLVVAIPKGMGKSYKELLEDKKGSSWKAEIKVDIDLAIAYAKDFDDFLKIMREKGYFIKQGENIKHMVVKKTGMEKGCRVRKLGEDYTEDAIRERIKYTEFEFMPTTIRFKKPKKKMKLIEKEMRRLYFRHAELETSVALGVHLINYFLTGNKIKIRTFPDYKKKKVIKETKVQIKILEKQLAFIQEHNINSKKELINQRDTIQENIRLLGAKEYLLNQERRNLIEIRKSIGAYEKFKPIYEELAQSGKIAEFNVRSENQWTVDKFIECKKILEKNGLADEKGQSIFFESYEKNKINLQLVKEKIEEEKSELEKYNEIQETLLQIKTGEIINNIANEVNKETSINEKQK